MSDERSERGGAQHTPGPWFTDGSRIFHQRNPGGLKLWIAETLQGNDTARQRKANARLVAAAPEMREALEAFVRFTNGSPDSGLECLNKQARAALAQARGGEVSAHLILWGWHPRHGTEPIKLCAWTRSAQQRRELEGWLCGVYRAHNEPVGLRLQVKAAIERATGGPR